MQKIQNKDILVIINPNSGKKRVSKIVETFALLSPEITTVTTKNPAELKNLFFTEIENYQVFIVAGGDGTVNEATKYLQGRTDKLLAVLPLGSGNGFARELGFKKSVKSLVEDAKKGEFIAVDLISINGENCINVAGLGFDSFVAHDFQKRNSRGLKSYIYSVFKSVFSFQPFYSTLIIGNEKIQDKFLMISIANTRQFGNNAIIAPNAKPIDGKLDLVLVKPIPVYYYPVFVFRLFWGNLKESKYLKFIATNKNILIKSEFKKFHIDGDPKNFTKDLFIKIAENKVSVLKTRNCSF